MKVTDMPVPILTYHSIDESGSTISKSPQIFRRQMRHLGQAGYRAITLGEFAEIRNRGEAVSDKLVVLTFDDGFRNFYTYAYPILAEHNFKATVFLVTDMCGQHNDWPGNPRDLPRSELLDWDEIRELSEAGIEFGSHTRTHADLTRLNPNEARNEMIDSAKQISDRLGREVSTFAYPYGRMNREARRVAFDNFAASCSTNLGKVGSRFDKAALNRIDTYYLSNERLFELMPTAAFDNYLRLRNAMRRVRSILYEH